MLKIQDANILDELNLNIIREKTKKTQILLYDTQRRFDDFIMKLKYRRNGKYSDIPHFIITKNGDVYQIFDMDYCSNTFNDWDIDKNLIKIAIENLGWLSRNTINGVLYNWIGDKTRVIPHIKKWRGYHYWDNYTDEQKTSIVELCKYITEKTNIPYQPVPSNGYIKNILNLKGIVCKSNFLNIYTDINPSFDFNIFYDEQEKTNK